MQVFYLVTLLKHQNLHFMSNISKSGPELKPEEVCLLSPGGKLWGPGSGRRTAYGRFVKLLLR